jgi:hypothetical protein
MNPPPSSYGTKEKARAGRAFSMGLILQLAQIMRRRTSHSKNDHFSACIFLRY